MSYVQKLTGYLILPNKSEAWSILYHHSNSACLMTTQLEVHVDLRLLGISFCWGLVYSFGWGLGRQQGFITSDLEIYMMTVSGFCPLASFLDKTMPRMNGIGSLLTILYILKRRLLCHSHPWFIRFQKYAIDYLSGIAHPNIKDTDSKIKYQNLHSDASSNPNWSDRSFTIDEKGCQFWSGKASSDLVIGMGIHKLRNTDARGHAYSLIIGMFRSLSRTDV